MDNYNPALITGERSHLVNVSWNFDKYPDEPEFTPHAKLTILDCDGPAAITNIHVSAYFKKGSFSDDSLTAASSMWITVYYNNSPAPSIYMPLMDFLGDVDCRCKPFSTMYFTKVKESHNFYLTMPFEKHVRIVVENRSDNDLFGYMSLQVEKLGQWDTRLGYLHTQYKDSSATIPDDMLELMDAEGNGSLVAHWLRIKSDNPLCRDGEYICEGNDEFYLDGEEKPALEYLGTEDFYGFSWGFKGEQSDGRSAITRQDGSENGIALCMLRTRREDRIRFYKSCRLKIDYTQEYFSSFCVNPRHVDTPKKRIAIAYKSCCYYYVLED
jgi:hypothetical protein